MRSVRSGPGALWVPALGVACAAVYLLSGPPHVGDLAAQTARAALFARSGFVPWWAGWYAGFHVAGYSLLTPALMAWLGPAGLGAVVCVLTAVVASVLLRPARRPGLAAAALTLTGTADVLSGRITFAAGGLLALLAALAAERRRGWAAVLISLAATVTSPVDGLLLGVLAGVYVLADPPRRRLGWGMGLAALAGIGLVTLPFPDPGYQPFTRTSMLVALAVAAVPALLPTGGRVRTGAVLTMVLVLAAYAVHTPVGSNATRMSLLVALPAVLGAARLRPAALALVAAGLAVYPLYGLVGDLVAAAEPAGQAAFYRPLAAELERLGVTRTHRVEVAGPRTHWQVVYLEPGVVLARGWERQIDESLNPLFYGRVPLTPASYRAFLDRTATAVVAVPVGTPLDFDDRGEVRLVRHGLPYLVRVWSDPHWRVYLVRRPAPLASGAGARVARLGDTGVVVTVRSAGVVRLRLRWTAYLTVRGGCLRPGGAGGTDLVVPGPGRYRVHAAWSLDGLLGRSGCRPG